VIYAKPATWGVGDEGVDQGSPPHLLHDFLQHLKDLMKRAKVTCAALAERLGVTGGVVRKARKNGVPGVERERWLEAIGPVPDVLPIKRRSRIRTVLNAIGAAAMWLLAVVLGNPNSG
jgi:hypothetical protein